jgi:hypothetical protein
MAQKSSLDVRIWGPEAWNFMHAVTFAYPIHSPSDQEKKNISLFFEHVGNNLPCDKCRHHFGVMLKNSPIDTRNRETVSKWLVDRHNDVNVRLGKPTLSYDFVKKKYQDMENTCPLEKKSEHHPASSCAMALKSAIMWCLLAFFCLLIIAIVIYVIVNKHQ